MFESNDQAFTIKELSPYLRIAGSSIPNKEETINKEKMNIILSGINEITEDVDAQVLILDELMEQLFFNILSAGRKDKIYDRTMKHARRVKDEKLDQLIRKHEQFEVNTLKEISKREEEIDKKESEIQSVSDEVIRKNKVNNRYIN